MALRADKFRLPNGGYRNLVFFDGDPILEIAIDNVEATGFPAVGKRAEAVLTWVANPGTSLRQHLNSVEVLFLDYHRLGYPATVELRMAGAHYVDQVDIQGVRLADTILGLIANHKVQPSDKPELVLIAAGDLAVEIGFAGGDHPVRCACALTLVVAAPMARYWRESHKDDRVRSQGETSQEIFANTLNPPLDAFFPIQVVEEL